MIIDMHTHIGRTRRNSPVDRAVLAPMLAGQMGAAVVSAIAEALCAGGLNAEEVEKICSGNWFRVFHAALA